VHIFYIIAVRSFRQKITKARNFSKDAKAQIGFVHKQHREIFPRYFIWSSGLWKPCFR